MLFFQIILRPAAKIGTMVRNFDQLAKVPQIDRGLLMLGSVLGKGATATAFKSSFGGKFCAAKVLNSEDVFSVQSDENVISEVVTLSKLGTHPNIVQFHGVCVENSSNLIIVLELVDGKDLEKYLSSLRDGFDLGKSIVQKWSHDLLSALYFLHNRDPILIHCDVKPANLVITPCKTSLKLTDFGISKSIHREHRQSQCLKANEGSPRYRAPEVLSDSEFAAYTEKSDIYSASLVIYYLLTGRRPENDVKIDPRWRPTTMVSRMRWRKVSDLLERMWAHDAEKRPSAGECAEYFSKLKEEDDDSDERLPRGCYAGLRWPTVGRRLVS